MSSTFQSLRNVNYRYYAAGSLVANTGTWFQRVAQDWLVLQITHSGTAVGMIIGLQFLPILLMGPWTGAVADRFPKRRLLQTTQGAMGITALVLAILVLSGVVQVWHVYVLALITGVATAFDNPARQSFVIEMVGKRDLPNAVGLNSASFQISRIIGPALAGMLIAVWGTGWVIFGNAISFGGTIIALALMKPELLQPAPIPQRTKGMAVEGLRYLRSRPDLVMILVMMFFVGCFGLNFQLTSVLMATKVFGQGSAGYGVLPSILAVGSVVGALYAARRGAPRLRTLTLSVVAFGVLYAINGAMPTYTLYVVLLPLIGFIQLTMITTANTTLQMAVAPDMRGRVMALYAMVFMGSTPIGSPVMGWIGDALGARWTLYLGGAMSVVGAVAGTYAYARLRHTTVRELIRAGGLLAAVPVGEPVAGSEPARAEEPRAEEPRTEEPRTEEPCTETFGAVAAEPVAAEPAMTEPRASGDARVSVARGRLSGWNLPGISRSWTRTRLVLPRSRRRDSAHPSRPARAGRSRTS